MRPGYKTIHRTFFAWNYQAEIEHLNKASEDGWQLVHGGCYSSKFVENPDIQYRYQIDFGNKEDMGRYIETFREQGWEYVNSTFNNWHYFRKLYDPSLPEEAYEIFTDSQSLKEMTRRWSRLALTIAIIMFFGNIAYLIDLIKRPCLPTFLSFAAILIECIVLFFGAYKIGKPDAKRSIKGDTTLFVIFLAVIIIGLASSITLRALRPNFYSNQQAGSMEIPNKDQEIGEFAIKYPDRYYVDLDFESSAPMSFKLTNSESGEVVFERTGTELHEDDAQVNLPVGTYTYSYSASAGYKLDLHIY